MTPLHMQCMSRWLYKFAEPKQPVTDDQAVAALHQLNDLESTMPSKGDLARGALAGSIVGPLGYTTNQFISGSHPLSKAIASRGPGVKGLAKAVGKGVAPTVRGMAGAGAASAAGGALIPIVRRKLDEASATETLKKYVEQNPEVLSQEGPTKVGGLRSTLTEVVKHPSFKEHGLELGGLGVLAVPSLDTIQASTRARLAGDKDPEAAERRRMFGETGHAIADAGGLGILMAPELSKLKGLHKLPVP